MMPRTPSLSIAFPPKAEVEGGFETPRSPPDSGIEDYYKRPQISTPQSPAQSPASPRASRSFFSGYRSNKQDKGKAKEQTAPKSPYVPSSGLSTPFATQSTYQLGDDSSSANLSQSNLLEALSVSEGSTQEGLAPSENGSTETDTTPRASEVDLLGQRRPSKHVFHNILNRTRSTRTDLSPRQPSKSASKGRFLEPLPREEEVETSSRTAPNEHERGHRDAMTAVIRNKSADRSAMTKENSNMISNIRNTSTSAASGLGRASKGLWGKLARNPSNNDKDTVPDENYVLRVINLPLVEQTRRTRICKKMAEARDKTEYWMPALPYRCIDYLNLKGVEEEGLYRIPGSGREIKHWQTRFDRELDVNLLDEQELYDINIIGSMLKAWLRELPDELFPKTVQAKIAAAHPGAKETPQMLKDELSKLPPYNYYLLFAITCHIALLHSHSDKNRMNYHNLCICFQPSLGIEGFCFFFLVCEWRTCWQGCWTEKDYMENEKTMMGLQVPPSSSGGHSLAPSTASSVTADMDALSLTSNSRPTTGGKGSSTTDRRRPSPISTKEEDGWDMATITNTKARATPSKSATVGSPSTPPSLSPVAQVSPMRL